MSSAAASPAQGHRKLQVSRQQRVDSHGSCHVPSMLGHISLGWWVLRHCLLCVIYSSAPADSRELLLWCAIAVCAIISCVMHTFTLYTAIYMLVPYIN